MLRRDGALILFRRASLVLGVAVVHDAALVGAATRCLTEFEACVEQSPTAAAERQGSPMVASGALPPAELAGAATAFPRLPELARGRLGLLRRQ